MERSFRPHADPRVRSFREKRPRARNSWRRLTRRSLALLTLAATRMWR
ncbi:MAG: hypothetical protein R3F54_32040 [Alphaproteobacteria bacterium]